MTTKKSPKFRVLFDEGVPVPAAAPFKACGHEVIFHQDVLEAGSKDESVCLTAIINNAILVAIDRDMRQLAKRFGVPDQNHKYSRLNLIFVCCNEVMALQRLEQAMSFIENEWVFSSGKLARRLWVDIGPHHLRSNR